MQLSTLILATAAQLAILLAAPAQVPASLAAWTALAAVVAVGHLARTRARYQPPARLAWTTAAVATATLYASSALPRGAALPGLIITAAGLLTASALLAAHATAHHRAGARTARAAATLLLLLGVAQSTVTLAVLGQAWAGGLLSTLLGALSLTALAGAALATIELCRRPARWLLHRLRRRRPQLVPRAAGSAR